MGFFLAWRWFEYNLHVREKRQVFVKCLRCLTYSKAFEIKPSIWIAVELRRVPLLPKMPLEVSAAVHRRIQVIYPVEVRYFHTFCDCLGSVADTNGRKAVEQFLNGLIEQFSFKYGKQF
jgi:hypothetical protein